MRITRLIAVSIAAFMFIIAFSWNARAAASDSNADLTHIHQGAGSLSPAFSPSVTEYWVRMSSSLQGFYTAAIPSNSGAVMEYSMNGGAWTGMGYNVSTGYIGTNRGDNTFQIRVTPTDNSTAKIYTLHVYYPPVNDADLSDLRLNETTLSPSFQPSVTGYTANVPYTTASISLTGVLDDPAASLTINGSPAVSGTVYGPVPLNTGVNTIAVHTASYDTSVSKTYTIQVTRAAPSTNAGLSALTVTGHTLEPVFQPAQTSYTLPDVSYTTDQLTVTPTAADSTASIKIRVNGGSLATVNSGSASGPLALNAGSNNIQIQVTAQDGTTTNTYTLTVKRKSNNAMLSGLTVSPGSFNETFNSGLLAYTMADVSYSTDTLTVTPTLSDPAGAFVHVRVNGGNYIPVTSGYGVNVPLAVGSNIVEAEVWAEDTTIAKTYTLTVKRLGNNDATLSGLTVSAGSLAFSSWVTDYTITVSQTINALFVKPYLSAGNTAATIQIRINGGSYIPVQSGTNSPSLSLTSGVQNKIEVLVTAQDGTTRLYTIKVNQAGTPVLNDFILEGMQAKLTFSEPLLKSVTDAAYYTIYNVTRDAALPVTDVVYTEGSPKVNLTLTGTLLPGDELELRIKAGAVTGMAGEINAAVNQRFFYGNPLDQMRQRLADLDTGHDGIQVNEIIAYMSSVFGQNDLNGDGQFTRDDVLLLLSQIGTKVLPSP